MKFSKTQLAVLIAVLFMAIVILIVWLLISRGGGQSTTEALPTPQLMHAQAGMALPSPAVPQRFEVPPGGSYQGLNDPRWKSWNAMKKIDPSFEWKMPINFFGKVVDQNNLPLAGAEIRFVWNDTSSRGTSESKATSDSNGRFALSDQRGKGLSVYVSKEGYHTSGGIGGMSFEYAAFFEGNYHQPNPESPVTFRLVKKLETEPLVTQRVSQYLPAAYDGETYYYDPRGGQLGRVCPLAGALKLSFERGPSPQGQSFDWKWTVEAVNGGLQETKDEFAQLAPENGYVGSWQISEAATSQPFRRSAKADFYVRTADNNYARVEIELSHPNSRSAGPNVRVRSFLNPSGSRNLEYDPAKEIKAK